jgi:hypothetical protein
MHPGEARGGIEFRVLLRFLQQYIVMGQFFDDWFAARHD